MHESRKKHLRRKTHHHRQREKGKKSKIKINKKKIHRMGAEIEQSMKDMN